MNFQKVYAVDPNLDNKDFLRSCFIYLLFTKTVPNDVFKGEFTKINVITAEVIIANVDVFLDYSCSIGYRNDYDEIDWQPFNGNSGVSDMVVATFNNRYFQTNYNSFSLLFSVNKISPNLLTPVNPKVVEAELESVKYLDSMAQVKAEDEVKLPGDYQRDFNSNAKYKYHSISCYIVPFYELIYKYNNTEYKLLSSASGEINVLEDEKTGLSYKKSEEELRTELRDKCLKEAKKKGSAPFIVWRIIFAVLAGGGAIGTLIYVFSIDKSNLGFFFALGIAPLLVFFLIMSAVILPKTQKKKVARRAIKLEMDADMNKMADCQDVLSINNLGHLTDSEINKFSDIYGELETKEYDD